MMRFLLLLLMFAPMFTYGRDRPIHSCEKAPQLAEFQKKLPGYILSSESDVPTKMISDPKQLKLFFQPGGLMRRAGSNLTCVVLVVDKEGTVLDAAVSYPAPLRFTESERKMLLGLRYEPAQIGGKPTPSLISMDLEFR